MTALARCCLARAWLVVAAWAIAVVALALGAASAPGATRAEFELPGSESGRALELLGDEFTAPSGELVVIAPGGVRRERVRTAVDALVARIAALPGVRAGATRPGGDAPYERVADDGTVATMPIHLDDPDQAAAVAKLRAGFREPGVTVELSGDEFAEPAPGGLAEGVGLVAAAVILFVAFGSLIATALPLLIGVVGVTCGVCLLVLLQNLIPSPDFAVYVTIMLGLAVGIDYALLVVTRFRTSLAAGLPVPDAVVTAMATAGRSVLYAGVTVIVTGSGILLLGPELGAALAVAVACGVLAVLVASLTLLPALLGMIGTRIDRFGLPRRRTDAGRIATSWSGVVRRRPGLTGALALGLLAALALPAADLRFGWSDASDRPVTDTTRRAHDAIVRGFGPGAEASLLLVAPGPLGDAAERARRTPGVASVIPLGDRTAVVVPATGPQDERTERLVHRLRADLPPPVLVTGAVAAGIDYAEHVLNRLPYLIGAVLLASYLLLMLLFRSLLVPLQAIVLNLLSIGAAYGVVVAVFQWDVLGLGMAGPIDAWVPMMLFVVMYGMSMDYEVFLLSRVHEEYLRTGDNARAVAQGLARSARVITAAAAIMFCVFAAFGAFDDRALRTMGVGLATAVLIDATVVRLVLVPAALELFGDRNWWFPGTARRRAAPAERQAVWPMGDL